MAPPAALADVAPMLREDRGDRGAARAGPRRLTAFWTTSATRSRAATCRLISDFDPPAVEVRRRLDAVLETFTGIAIPQMLAVGTHLVES